MLTVYDYSTAKLMDEAGIEAFLVGDSLGNTILGYPDTLSVTMEDMIHHCKAVARGTKDALVVCDMPFMSYQTSVYDAVANAGRLVKEGMAQAVKLEGGAAFAPHIQAITQASIPVCAHLGLTPQSVNAFGGFKVQGKDEESAMQLVEDALAVEAAGAFALVLECVPAPLTALVTDLLDIPTIGIGAGSGTDGQVLVYQDMLAMYGGKSPKFAKVFADAGALMRDGFAAYIQETKKGAFPAEEHTFCIDPEIMEKIKCGIIR
jgi:3-methyl-2-oxobutanoate hydroxymethyltransferase